VAPIAATDDPALVSLDLTALHDAGGLTLRNVGLTSFTAPMFAHSTQSVQVSSNAHLTALAFPMLTTVDGSLMVESNPVLTTLQTPTLGSVQQLYVTGDSVLPNLDGLSALHTIQSNMSIISNTALTSVTGLNGVPSIGGWFTIQNNTSLPTASATALRDHIGTGNIAGTITISGNAP
jgi:hypothetical protein